MKATVKYTVIIPHYNSQSTLIRCIDSVPRNDLFQIIVVDDCSDKSIVDFDYVRQSVCRSFELIALNENKGAGYARNIGMSKAAGTWIIFADADDYFTPDAESILENATQKHNSDIIIFNIDSTENNSVQGIRYHRFVNSFDGSIETLENVLYRSWSPWAKLFKRDLINDNKLYFESRKKGNDCFFVLNAIVSSKHIQIINEPLYHLTYSQNSLSHTNTEKWEYMFDIYDLWLWRYRFFRNNGIRLWKEYNIFYLAREVYKKFGIKKCLNIILLSIKYKYDYWALLTNKISI